MVERLSGLKDFFSSIVLRKARNFALCNNRALEENNPLGPEMTWSILSCLYRITNPKSLPDIYIPPPLPPPQYLSQRLSPPKGFCSAARGSPSQHGDLVK